MTFKEYLEIEGNLTLSSLGVENRHRSRITNLLILFCTFLILYIVSNFLIKSLPYFIVIFLTLTVITAICLIWQAIRLYFWKKFIKKIRNEIRESYKNKADVESAYKIIQKYFGVN